MDYQQAVVTNVDNVLKVAEVFRETSEVSTTLLGVNRAETQLSLFSNVSSYGINTDEWETFSYADGNSFPVTILLAQKDKNVREEMLQL